MKVIKENNHRYIIYSGGEIVGVFRKLPVPILRWTDYEKQEDYYRYTTYMVPGLFGNHKYFTIYTHYDGLKKAITRESKSTYVYLDEDGLSLDNGYIKEWWGITKDDTIPKWREWKSPFLTWDVDAGGPLDCPVENKELTSGKN